MSSEVDRLSPEARRELLALARDSIRAGICGELPPKPTGHLPELLAPGAAFVTLYEGEELRGCIGTVEWTQPLWEAVRRVARLAALDDPRFAPVQVRELQRLTVEISRLTPLQPATPAEIELGRHGVCLELHSARSLFLPKVATEQGWGLRELLLQLCRKAMLPDDAWMSPAARLFTFTAEVFRDSPS